MNVRFLHFLLAGMILLGATSASANLRISNKEFKRYYGTYYGIMTGAYGQSSGGLLEFSTVRYDRNVKIDSRRRVPSVSPTEQVHRLIYKKPTGTNNRVRLFGIYRGSSWNPFKGYFEPVMGTRRIVLVDRGRGSRARYVMRMSNDFLQEGTLSYLKVKGKLVRTKGGQ